MHMYMYAHVVAQLYGDFACVATWGGAQSCSNLRKSMVILHIAWVGHNHMTYKEIFFFACQHACFSPC